MFITSLVSFLIHFSSPAQAGQETALCESVGLSQENPGEVVIYKTSDRYSPVIRRASLKTLGTELLSGGIDVQTNEPKDAVFLRPSPQEPKGRFELVLQDHSLKEDGHFFQEFLAFPCSDAANRILGSAVQAARN
ncbi:MAG: hypothetical protein EBX52_08025 [Proteobacteria bacterium]|nr:hypothetical protein [Pseudomonadota bacterium]